MRNMVESVMGFVVLVVACLFVYLAYTTARIQTKDGYELSAAFFKVGGLKAGSDVRINGIKVGTVSSLDLDPETFEAVVRLTISGGLNLPTDTVAGISSEGILGGKYVSLTPGGEATVIVSGGRLQKVQNFRSLEDQVGEIIFLATGGQDARIP
ncbi:MAG: MlaD family protein [Rhodospirillales bacterium]|jgi:phospholipid/cholesterol/gamma-HCH transport system substrate-binding protein